MNGSLMTSSLSLVELLITATNLCVSNPCHWLILVIPVSQVSLLRPGEIVNRNNLFTIGMLSKQIGPGKVVFYFCGCFNCRHCYIIAQCQIVSVIKYAIWYFCQAQFKLQLSWAESSIFFRLCLLIGLAIGQSARQRFGPKPITILFSLA